MSENNQVTKNATFSVVKKRQLRRGFYLEVVITLVKQVQLRSGYKRG